MFLSCLISFAQYPKKSLKVYLSRQYVYIFQYILNPYTGFGLYWQRGKAMGKYIMRPSHGLCKPDFQHLKGCRICCLSLFLFSFYCVTISVLLCHLFLGFSYWDLEKPCTILPTYPPRGAEQDVDHVGQRVHRQDRRGRAHVLLLRENLLHKISL